MLFYVVTLLVSIASLVAVSAEYDSVIYVDPEYGRVDNSCWTGGADVPCKTVELALEGARRVSTNISPVVLVQPKCPTAAQCSCSNVTSGSITIKVEFVCVVLEYMVLLSATVR